MTPEIPDLDEGFGSTVVAICVKDGNIHMVARYDNNANDWHYAIAHDGKKFPMDAGLKTPKSWGINGSFLSDR